MRAVEAARVASQLGELADEIIGGGGVVRIRRALVAAQIRAGSDALTGTDVAPSLRASIHPMLADTAPLVAMVAHDAVGTLVDGVIGDGARLASIEVRRSPAGAPGEDPSLAYPYWDLHNPEAFPRHVSGAFALGVVVLFPLADLRAGAGGPVYAPGSQTRLEAPDDHDRFGSQAVPMRAIAGDAIVCHAGCQMAWMPNTMDAPLVTVAATYVAKFVEPLADLSHDLPQQFLESAPLRLRSLVAARSASPEPKRVVPAPPPRQVSRRAMFTFGVGEADD